MIMVLHTEGFDDKKIPTWAIGAGVILSIVGSYLVFEKTKKAQ